MRISSGILHERRDLERGRALSTLLPPGDHRRVVLDGLTLPLDTMRLEEVRDEAEYDGTRVRVDATLAGARIPIQIDFAFGDPVVPAPGTSIDGLRPVDYERRPTPDTDAA